MKKISLLLTLLTCATVTHKTVATDIDKHAQAVRTFLSIDEENQENIDEHIQAVRTFLSMDENQYDFQRDLKKFKEKNKNKDYTQHELYQKEPLYPMSLSLKESYEEYSRRLTVRDWPEHRDELIEILEQNGAEAINSPTLEGYGGSPLYWAVQANDFAFVKFCLQHGGRLNDGPKGDAHSKKDPYHLMGNAQTVEMIKYLEENGEDVSPLLYKDIKNPLIHAYIETAKEKKRKLQEEFVSKVKEKTRKAQEEFASATKIQ